MVFEGILVDILNRFLGPYVKNLDASQLRVGIWGGDVLLEKLELKENALADLNLPIKIFGGYLGKLRLKIPWKNLYSDPVIADVDGVYVLVGPATAAKYSAEQEAKELKDAKEKQLKRIEEAKRKAKEPKEKKEEAAPGFVDKLVTQIIKNVQIRVKNIHVQYEDAVTNPSSPFSCGVTLDSLLVQSTDSNYNIGGTETDPTSLLIYKLVQMNCLAVYWNSQAKLFGTKLPENWTDQLKEGIARPGFIPSSMKYVVNPISAEAKLRLITKPGKDADVPQALVQLVMKEVAVALSKQQYHDILCLVESLDRMSINQKYFKYKPEHPVSEDLRGWWRYAITAVLEEDVKRRTKMWSWRHIKHHRELCKAYTKAYTTKLLSKSVSASLETELEKLEAKLDVFNITACRQQAESKVERELEGRKKQKEAESGGGWWAWATGWSGGRDSSTKEKSKPPTDEELAKEKQKLYDAIGYQEDGPGTVYSKEYVAHEVHFQLCKVSLKLGEEKNKRAIAHVTTHEVRSSVLHRPGSSNISVVASIQTLRMTGLPHGKQQEEAEAPEIVSRKHHQSGSQEEPLLHVEFDLHPLGSKADQRIRATLLPVQVTYDGNTVDAIIDMFLLPKDIQLQKLSAAAASTLEGLKTQTRAGLEHAISKRKLLDLDITLHSPYIVVPENGVMSSSSSVLVAYLGQLHITSDMKYNVPNVREASMGQLEEAFYDHFNLELTRVQVIIAAAGEDWSSALAASSSLHLLEPTGFTLLLKKSLLPNDTRLPNLKVSGRVPKLIFSLSDKKVKQVLQLVQSIPIPPPSLANRSEESKQSYAAMDEPTPLDADGIVGSLTLEKKEGEEGVIESDGYEYFTASEGEYDENGVLRPSLSHEKEVEVASTTKLHLEFDIDMININFSEHNIATKKDTLLLDLEIVSVATTVDMTSWQLSVGASIGNTTIRDHYIKGSDGDPGMLLEVDSSEGSKFLSVQFAQYDRRAPQYTTTFQTTRQHIDARMSHVKLNLKEKTMVNLMAVGKSIAAVLKTKDQPPADSEAAKEPDKSGQAAPEDGKETPHMGPKRLSGEKDLCVTTMLEGVQVTLGDILTANVTGLKADVNIYGDRTEVKASMTDVTVLDRDQSSTHPKVVCKVDQSQEIISTTVVVYKGATRGNGYMNLEAADLSVEAQVQRVRVTVVFNFLNRIKNFATELVDKLKLDQKTIESAREAAAKTASRTAEALKENSSSRVRLAVTVQAPLVLIPLSATSQSALVADLGQLTINNKFLLASDPGVGGAKPGVAPNAFLSSDGLPAVVDCMEVFISSIQLGRVTNLEDYCAAVPVNMDHVILKPLVFCGHVTRKLSDWCSVIPAIDVTAELEAVEVSFSPEDFQAVMSVVDSINDGRKEAELHKGHSEPKEEQEEEGKPQEPKEEGEKTEETSNIHVKARVGEVRLTLHSSCSGNLADVRVKGVSADVNLLGPDIQVESEVTDIEVADLSANNTLYPKIISVAEGTKALKAKVMLYTEATKGDGKMDMDKCDLSVEARVGQLRVVALFLFINRLLAYFKQFDVSKKAIESAKKSAQERATAAMSAVQELHQNGQRLRLDIAIDAPEITIPVSSHSQKVIVAYLGFLRLSNTFHLVERGAGGGAIPGTQQQQRAIFERYTIELKDLQMYRQATRHEAGETRDRRHKCLILKPFNLMLEMKRNLSAAWFNEIPTIDITAKLGTLKLVASDEDVELMHSVLEGNLKEGKPREEKEESSKDKSDEVIEKKEEEVEKTASQEAIGKVEEEAKESEEKETYLTLKISAELQSIGIELYNEDKDPIHTDDGTWKRDPENALAEFTLELFTARASVWNNGAIEAGITMENCIMDDCRPEKKGKIARLLQRSQKESSTPGSTPKPLIGVDFNKSQWNEAKVDADVQGIEVLVDLKFILTLVNFVTSSLKPLTKTSGELEPDYEEMGTKRKEESDSKTKDTSESQSTSKSSEPPSQSTVEGISKMNISVRVSRPCIALLENAELNSKALVLGAELELVLVIAHGQMNMTTTLSNLSVATTTYQSRYTPIAKVLHSIPKPITASLNSLQGPKMIVQVEIPSLSLVLSPPTVRLILHVVQSLRPDKSEEEETEVTSPHDLWTSKPLNRKKWYLQPPVKEIEEEGTSVDPPEKMEKVSLEKEESLTFTLEWLSIVIEQEHLNGRTSPAVALTMGKYGSKAVTMTAQNWSGKLSAAASLSLEASYYNLRHDAWEPILEPVTDQTLEGAYRSWTLTAEVDKPALAEESVGGRGSSKSQQTDLSPELAIRISSRDALQLTATKTSMGLFKELLTTYLEEKVIEGVDQAAETFEAAYVLTNKLGSKYPVIVTPENGLKVHGAYSSTVRSGATVPLHPVGGPIRVKPGELLPRDAHLRKIHILQLQIGGFHPLKVALGTSEKVLYPLWPTTQPERKDKGGKEGIKFGLVVEIERQETDGAPLVVLRSPLQIVNHLEESVAVYWNDVPSHTTLSSSPLTTVAAGATKPLPLDSAHSGVLYVQPGTDSTYRLSEQALSWNRNTHSLDVACPAEKGGSMESKTFFIHAQFKEEDYSKKPSFPLNSLPHHILHLHYPLITHNLLPSTISVGANENSLVDIQPGKVAHFQHTNLSEEHTFWAKLNDDGKIWSGKFTLGPKTDEYSTFTLSTTDSENAMVLTIRKEDKGTWHISVYSPYWMVNKSRMTLEYKRKWHSNVVTHPSDKTTVFFSHSETEVRVVKDGEASEWSKSFTLDAVGSEGIFSCKFKHSHQEYQMGSTVQLSRFALTKIITISPFYLLYNKTKDNISLLEKGLKHPNVITVPPKKLLPFWPQTTTEMVSLTVNDPTMTLSSIPFKFTETSSLLIRTRNSEIPAVEVEIQVTGSANILTFSPYYPGCVPLQLVNDTEMIIHFKQDTKSVQNYLLMPGQSLMYTWDDPSEKHEILWKFMKRRQKYRITSKDEDGEFPIPRQPISVPDSSSIAEEREDGEEEGKKEKGVKEREDKEREGEEEVDGEEGDDDDWVIPDIPEDVFDDDDEVEEVEEESDEPDEPDSPDSPGFIVRWARGAQRKIRSSLGHSSETKRRGQKGYWISFLDGLQHVILFTDNEDIRSHIRCGNQTERAHLELTLSLIGMGLSLVDDIRGVEIAYIGLPQSSVIWEEQKRLRRWKAISHELKNQLEALYSKNAEKEGEVQIPNTDYTINFASMQLTEKKSRHKKNLRRSHFEGVYAQVALSEHLTSVEARINGFQIDNQLPFALNPTIIYAFPTPPKVASKYAPKPFVEASLIIRKTEQSSVNEIQFLQVLVQEVGVNIDLSFILAVTSLFAQLPSTATEADRFEMDVLHTELPLIKSKVAQVSAVSTRNYFKYLHLSPLDIHLSFSLEKRGYEDDSSEGNVLLGVIFNVLLQFANIIGRTKDAELRLGYFQLEDTALTQDALMDRIKKHYMQEAAIQMYSIVLGLEVLGNPVGFIKGLADGAIGLFYQPIQGAVLGPGEFFEGLSLGGRQFLGGTLGGVSGVAGKITGVLGDAVAKLTFDEEFQDKRHKDSFSHGLEGAARGFVEGVTGVVTQPVKGAKKEGVWGFVKGTGKGVLGLVLRPTGGLIDLTSASLNAVQKITRVGDIEVPQIRPARYIGPEKLVEPYSQHKANGYALFLAFDDGRLADKDTYFDHLELIEDPLKILLITSNQFLVIKQGAVFGKWDDDWKADFQEICGLLSARDNIISIPVEEEQSALLGIFSPKKPKIVKSTKSLTVQTQELAKKATSLINQAYEEYSTTQNLGTN